MEFKKVQIDTLQPASYNPRKDLKPGDKEYEKIKNSIESFGYVDPIIANKDFTIIGGHQRLKVLKHLGFTEVDCVIIDIDKTKEKALNIALNKVGGSWSEELLADLIKDLQEADFDISLTGFEPPEIDELFNKLHDKDIQDDDFDVDGALSETPISQQGDVWLLGRHRLVCGDSTNPATYEVLMEGKKANLVVTDPPYNISIQGGTKDKLTIQNDSMPDKDFYEFLFKFYQATFDVMEDGAGIYVFHADTEGINFRRAFKEAGFHLSGVCIWVKNSLVLGRADYHFRHEPILYGWKSTGKHRWYSDRKQDTVWEFDRPSKNPNHPTTKPIPLIAYPIQNSSMSNCIVLDPFAGSFSTGIACEQTNRICYAIELDPKYVDVCVSRFINYAGSDEGVFLIRDGKQIKYSDVINVEEA